MIATLLELLVYKYSLSMHVTGSSSEMVLLLYEKYQKNVILYYFLYNRTNYIKSNNNDNDSGNGNDTDNNEFY